MAVDPDFLRWRPRRLLEWEQEGERVVVLRPKMGSGRVGRLLTSWLSLGHYRIRLDDMGTLVWKSLDGATPLSEVAARLRKRFGESIEPAEDRLYQFMMQMVRARLVQ